MKWNHTIKGKAKRLLMNKRRECIKKNISFDLDEQWYYDRLEVGCALTGLTFKLDSSGKVDSKSPTVDRIDPDKGYIKTNCRMILHCLNAFKGAYTDETMYDIATLLISRKGRVNQEVSIKEKKEYDITIAIEKKQMLEAEQKNFSNILAFTSNMLLKNELSYSADAELTYIIKEYFTDRQLDIILKRYNQLQLSKTESEYYSRIIKKRLVELSKKE
jgi:hypothetical protein